MKPTEFNSIPDIEESLNVVLTMGTYLDERVMYGKYYIEIYALFDFYVEVWTSLKTRSIAKIKALESDEDWKGFLDSVKLRTLL